jgi:hypothetical protein
MIMFILAAIALYLFADIILIGLLFVLNLFIRPSRRG